MEVMVLDATVQAALDDAELDEEMERLLANRPRFAELGGKTDPEIEEGKNRLVTSTAAELTIYNRETGEPSQVIFDALRARMGQKFPDDYENPKFRGKKVYTTHKDQVPSVTRGTMACPLWHENPSEEALALGFGRANRACNKPPYFMTQYDVDLHVQKNHKRFYELKAKLEAEKQQKELMELQRQTLLAMQKMSTRGPGRPRKEEENE